MVPIEQKMKNEDENLNHKMFQESIMLTDIKKRKRYEQREFKTGTRQDKTSCILTRYNGFKGEMPNKPGQWQLLENDHDNCWVCDKWTFTLVFFNPSKAYQKSTSAMWDKFDEIKDFLKQKLRKFHGSEQVQMNIDDTDAQFYLPQYNNIFMDDDESVHVFSNFSNWNPIKMIPFLKYVELMDKDRPTESDIITIIRKKQEAKLKERLDREREGYLVKDQNEIIQIGQKVKTYAECNNDEKEIFLKEYNSYRMKLKQGKWEEVLQKGLKYKKPAILNLEVKELQKPDRLYVLPTFVRNGKQYMLFKYEDLKIEACEWVFERGILDYRQEEIIQFAKEGSSYTVQRRFAKETSIFKDWIEDTPDTYKKCLEHDFQFWKIQKQKFDPQEKLQFEMIFEQYFGLIKHIFLVIASDSEFPAISMVNLSKFIKSCNIIDRTTRSDRIDQLYLNACGALDPKDMPSKYMNRWSFLEFVFRLGIDKYPDKSKAEAIKQLLIQNFEPNFKQIEIYEPWQEVRQTLFWNLQIDDILKTNQKGIIAVFKKFSKGKATITLSEVVQAFINYPKLGINEKQARFAYGMSKMTVVQEFSANRYYENMKFVEFLEMICRLSIVRYKGQEQEGYELQEKLTLFLDDLLALVGLKCLDVELKDEEISESDQDY